MKTIAAIAALAATAATMSACGSSSNASDTSQSEIRVGVVAGFGGPLASSVGIARDAIQAWADSVNAHGGIDGRKVHLYIQDDAGDTGKAVSEVKQLVERDRVVALVGQISTPGAAAWNEYATQKGIPVIGGNATDLLYARNANFYSTGANLISDFYGVAATAKASGPKLGVIYCAESPSCAAVTSIVSALQSTTGVSVGYSGKVAASTPDFTAQCQGIKSSGVQAYTLALAADLIKRVAEQCHEQGVRAQLIEPLTIDDSFAKIPALEGMKVVDSYAPFWDTSTRAGKEMHDAMGQFAPAIGTSKPYAPNVIMEWTAGKLLEAAVKAGGSGKVTSASIEKGLHSLKEETLGGITTPLTFTDGKPNPINCYFSYEVQNGAWAKLNDGKSTCAPDSLISAIIAKL